MVIKVVGYHVMKDGAYLKMDGAFGPENEAFRFDTFEDALRVYNGLGDNKVAIVAVNAGLWR